MTTCNALASCNAPAAEAARLMGTTAQAAEESLRRARVDLLRIIIAVGI